MIYNLRVDLETAIEQIEDMCATQIMKSPHWIKVIAQDPDEACHLAMKKVCDAVNKKWEGDSDEIVEIVKNYMKVVKIEKA